MKRLIAEGQQEEAESLKGSKYILCSSKKTLKAKDERAAEQKAPEDGQVLFKGGAKKAHCGGNVERYEKLIGANRLLFTSDLVKEKLSATYAMKDEPKMSEAIIEIMDICNATQNEHFMWFANLLENHFEGIIAHASLAFSSGKVEGINNMIKTIRRTGYGYPDYGHFFLKIMDQSRKDYGRNEKSHRKYD